MYIDEGENKKSIIKDYIIINIKGLNKIVIINSYLLFL